MSEQPKMKIVKKGDRPAPEDRDKYIESHEDSLLSLLIAKKPERAREFLRRLEESMKVAA